MLGGAPRGCPLGPEAEVAPPTGAYAFAAADEGRAGMFAVVGDATLGVDCPALGGGGRGAALGCENPGGPAVGGGLARG